MTHGSATENGHVALGRAGASPITQPQEQAEAEGGAALKAPHVYINTVYTGPYFVQPSNGVFGCRYYPVEPPPPRLPGATFGFLSPAAASCISRRSMLASKRPIICPPGARMLATLPCAGYFCSWGGEGQRGGAECKLCRVKVAVDWLAEVTGGWMSGGRGGREGRGGPGGGQVETREGLRLGHPGFRQGTGPAPGAGFVKRQYAPLQCAGCEAACPQKCNSGCQ